MTVTETRNQQSKLENAHAMAIAENTTNNAEIVIAVARSNISSACAPVSPIPAAFFKQINGHSRKESKDKDKCVIA